MNLDFDFAKIRSTEFGVGFDNRAGQTFVAIPVDVGVQTTLHDMVFQTRHALEELAAPTRYEPSEKYGSVEYVLLPLDDGLTTSVRQLHEAGHLPLNAGALADPARVFCYFTRLTDDSGRRVTALRRAALFKGALKSKNRFVRIIDNTLEIVRDTLFRLDVDFDILMDSVSVHILRPSSFEYIGGLQEAILGAVPENVQLIATEIPFVDFGGIQDYASRHPRAARYLASIRGQAEMQNVDQSALKRLCKRTGVELRVSKGMLSVPVGHEMGFLEVLDRRRYELELVKGMPERFKAASRTKLTD